MNIDGAKLSFSCMDILDISFSCMKMSFSWMEILHSFLKMKCSCMKLSCHYCFMHENLRMEL